MISDKLNCAIKSILEENYETDSFILSESLNQALKKINDNIHKAVKANDHRDSLDRSMYDFFLKHNASDRKYSEDLMSENRNMIRIYAREFSKIGVDVNKLEYDQVKTTSHVIDLLESNNVVVITRASVDDAGLTYSNMHFCLPLVEKGELAKVALIKVTMDWDGSDGGHKHRAGKILPTSKLDKLTSEDPKTLKIIPVSEFKSAYSDMIKDDRKLNKTKYDSYYVAVVDIITVPINKELSKEVLTKLKIRQSNARITKKLEKQNQKLYVKNAKVFKSMIKKYSEAGLKVFNDFIDKNRNVGSENEGVAEAVATAEAILKFENTSIDNMKDAYR